MSKMSSKQVVAALLMAAMAATFVFGATTLKRPAVPSADASAQASKKAPAATQKSNAETTAPKGAHVAIAFDFNRADKKGTDQFAIWIEDSQGKLVRTIYVTNYTVKKGAAKYSFDLPTWSEKSGIHDNANVADAVAGATPAKGHQTYYWDLTDQNNKAVAPGTYRIIVEGTQSKDEQVLFINDMVIGGDAATVNVTPSYYTGTVPKDPMLASLTLTYKP